MLMHSRAVGTMIVLSLVFFTAEGAALSQRPQERIETYPNDPIMIESVELEEGATDLRSLVLKVRNTSEEPIYFASFLVKLPEAPVAPGVGSVFQLSYGRGALAGGRELPTAEDRPINPGESIRIALPEEQYRHSVEYYRSRGEQPPQITYFIVRVNHVTFDGHRAYVANQYYTGTPR